MVLFFLSEASYTPPPIESQYYHVHPSNIPPDRLAEMKRQIAAEGVYVGEIARFSGLNGAVEVVEPTRTCGLLKIMPNAIDLPADHPVKRGGAHEVRMVTDPIVQPPSVASVGKPAIAERQRMPSASPEEVQEVRSQAETLVRVQGQAWEFTPHIRSYKVPWGVPRSAAPEAARQSLGLGDAKINCEVMTNSRDGKTSITFWQIFAPEGYPGYFEDSVTYDLSGSGERVAEATIVNTQILLEIPNPDHHSGAAAIEKPEVQQLVQLLSSFELAE